jgi:hypothetical protein
MNLSEHLLVVPTETLGLSSECKLMAEVNGFSTLQQIIDFGIHQLPTLPGSSYRIQQEVLEFLDGRGLLYLVEDFGE